MNTEQERAQQIRDDAARWRSTNLIDVARESAIRERFPQPWRANSFILQIIFFALAAVAVRAFYELVALLEFSRPEIITGIVAIASAELLVRRGWYRTGVEAALLICGLVALIFALPSSGSPEALLVFAAAFLIAAARLRHPLFAVVAVGFVMAWTENRFDGGLLFALVMSTIAAFALTATLRRPSSEVFLALSVLVLPVAGRFFADEQWRRVTIALYLIYAATALFLGITRKHHALFLSAAVALTIASIDIARFFTFALELRLALGGVLLLAAAFALHRMLRDRTTGFVVHDALTSHDDSLEIAATLTLQPHATPAPEQPDGRFGGAGASGDY